MRISLRFSILPPLDTTQTYLSRIFLNFVFICINCVLRCINFLFHKCFELIPSHGSSVPVAVKRQIKANITFGTSARILTPILPQTPLVRSWQTTFGIFCQHNSLKTCDVENSGDSNARDCIFRKHFFNRFSVAGMCLPWLWMWAHQLSSLPEDDHHRGQAG